MIPGLPPGRELAVLGSPFYAVSIDARLAIPHEPILSEDEWVAANAALIGSHGAETWLRSLLAGLKDAAAIAAAPPEPGEDRQRP